MTRKLQVLAFLLTAAAAAACSNAGSAPASTPGTIQGDSTPSPSPSADPGGTVTPRAVSASVPAATMRVHYHRNDGAYTNWGVYAFSGPAMPSTGWPGNRFLFDTSDADGWGQHVDIALNPAATDFGFLITLPNASNTDATKDCPTDQHAAIIDAATNGQEIWVISGDCTVFQAEPPLTPVHLGNAAVVWLTPDTLVWPGADATATYKMYVAANGGLAGDSAGAISGADAAYDLTVDPAGLPAALKAMFPQYASATVLKAPAAVVTNVKMILTGEIVVVETASTGSVVDGTQVQTAPVLDAVYAAAARQQALGVTFDRRNVPTFKVWAPTAKSVMLNVFADQNATTAATSVNMTLDAASGVWSYTGNAAAARWTDKAYYTFSVQVYSRSANSMVVTNEVTDPYSVSLNGNSVHSLVLNLTDRVVQPEGWPGRLIPTSATPTDSVLYELHIRDFSANTHDTTFRPEHKGKYLAFTDNGSDGVRHLRALADAGLTHLHLLPSFDISSVDELHCVEDPAIPEVTGAAMEAQAAVIATQGTDCFNWGYDPFHYGAPEGSYATDPNDGTVRVKEFRQMVQAIHRLGLRVVMDVVYNHTTSAGQTDNSVLDKIVPGYYYRLDAAGTLENDSCCADTAPEHAMMAKLMIDTLVQWADQYKVDGFRFDLMSFIPLAVMLDARDAVDAVTHRDGRGFTYFYGEGWNFGHVGNDALFVQARQAQLIDTGIGSFNDRIRDAVRGGGPFDSGAAMVTNQGFVSGLCYDNNDGSACSDAQLNDPETGISVLQDRISIGLAGNLANFILRTTPAVVRGRDVDYFGQPTGYTGSPQENIPYVSVHDNETIWDVSQYKHPLSTSPADRARAQVVALSIPLLSQGVPFLHAGDDLLRSKSDDSNSFNSGDYFNRIFWDGSSNNWSVGAPPQNTGNNAANLAQEQVALTNPNAVESQSTILDASAAVQDFLRIRHSTSMFSLTTAAEVNNCVSFPDQALGKVPGLIVMQIGDGVADCGDDKFDSVVVLFNASKTAQAFADPDFVQVSMQLHPVQVHGADRTVTDASFDRRTGTFHVPARTTAVFVEQARPQRRHRR
jgi:pullulanase/glycogen debranching enzyme